MAFIKTLFSSLTDFLKEAQNFGIIQDFSLIPQEKINEDALSKTGELLSKFLDRIYASIPADMDNCSVIKHIDVSKIKKEIDDKILNYPVQNELSQMQVDTTEVFTPENSNSSSVQQIKLTDQQKTPKSTSLSHPSMKEDSVQIQNDLNKFIGLLLNCSSGNSWCSDQDHGKKMAFATVFFQEDSQFAVVPVTWIKAKCVWPACKRKNVTRLAVTEATSRENWLWHEVKILSIHDTFEDAMNRDKTAVDVDTDSEESVQDHRINKGKEKTRKRKKESSLFISEEEERATKRLHVSFGQDDDSSSSFTHVIVPDIIELQEGDNAVPINQNEDKSNCQSNPSNSSQPPGSILKDISRVRVTLGEHGQTLKSILLALNSLMERESIQTSFNQTSVTAFPVSLPLQTYNDVVNLEAQLSVDEELQEHLCTLISQVGGMNLGNTVRRMLGKLMSYQAAMFFSWFGAKEKHAFSKLILSKVLFEAVRRNKEYETVLDTSIEAIIKDWLRHAKERSKCSKEK